MTKVCKECKKELPLNMFGTFNKNIRPQCKSCYNKRYRESNRKANIAYRQQHDTKEYYRNKRKLYRQNEDTKNKDNCRSKVQKAILSGKLIKPNKCEECNSTINIEAHHNDYNKPLEVIWLCSICHSKRRHYK